jgi:hypothetical protein
MGGGCDGVVGVRRAEARLLATMALVRELRVRLGAETCGAGDRCRLGVEIDRDEGLRVGCARRRGVLSASLTGDMGRDCTDEAETNVSLDEVELCDGCRGFGVRSWS